MTMNYLLIDYENVQPKSLLVLSVPNGHRFKIFVFLGANQAKVPTEFARALQPLGVNAKYVQISGNGPNAVDFHIAYTVGELAKSEPDASFHIISKDSGFDPLIEYLRKKRISAKRSTEFGNLPMLKMSKVKSIPEKLEIIVRNLASRGAGKPRKVKALSNTIKALFPTSLGNPELANLMKTLEKHGHISMEGENVRYHLPEAL
jgi:hypothetical protein